MKNKLFLCILLATLIAPLYSEEQSQDGVKVSIEKIDDTLKGFKAFKVTAQNETANKKSAEIKILLNDNTTKEPGGARGDCTVFLKLDPNGSASEEKQCKEKKPSNSWSFQIKKIYNFHLE